MPILNSALSAIEAVFAALWQRLDRPRSLTAFAVLVPIFFGLLSVHMGQDDNWDLHNYHLYNPYALVNGKINFDLAPAQWQSYFNPTIDLLYYGLVRTLPGPWVGFIMGALHGLNLVLVLALARRLANAVAPVSYRATLLLALAGCFGPGFLQQLGNTMGDNLTSLFVLSSLLVLVARWERLQQPGALAVAIFSGVLMGAGTGLKLTNATFALALCLALLSLPGSVWLRLRTAFVFGVGVLGGMGATAGWWYWKMWAVFGNPLFPQFNDRFHALLAAPIGMGDTGWMPKTWPEKLLWPFIFTLNPKRTIEIPMTQIIWPMLYVAIVALGLIKLRAWIRSDKPTMPSQVRFVLLFVAFAYLLWLKLFGIYRYLVPFELLAPLLLWLVVHSMMPAKVARGVAGYGLLLACLSIFPVSNWGRADWSRESFSAQPPVFTQPEQSMVFTVHGDPPMGWLVPFFPQKLAFVALGSGFPESGAYAERVASMMASRSGTIYVMLHAEYFDPNNPLPPEQAQAALDRNAGVILRAREILGRYGITLNADACTTYKAFTGKSLKPFQLCTVNKPTPKAN